MSFFDGVFSVNCSLSLDFSVGVGTVVEKGHFPTKYNKDGTVACYSQPKETREFNGKKYVLEESFTGDYACIKAWKADTLGNIRFHSTARNFNPDCAKAGKITIVEVEEIVEPGEIKPDDIHLPGIYIQRIVKGENYENRIEKLTFRSPDNTESNAAEKPKSLLTKRERIAERAAKEFKDGMYVNLGIGIPTVVANFIPKELNVVLQSENGLLGIGPYPLKGEHHHDLINAGKETVSYLPGSSTFASSDSFAMIRGKHIDLTILGCLEVSQEGDLASWIIPGKTIKGMGGAMDLVSACERVSPSLSSFLTFFFSSLSLDYHHNFSY
jgi:3-oxoacid CoA-transferase